MSAPVKEGDVLADKYRVERILGEGGMGVVVAATHLQLEQRVALKFLLPIAMQNEEIVARFAREARAAARIKTEHVARVIDVGALESGAPYMVMEYLEGKDLEQIVDERGALPVAEAVSYVLQALEAVAEAHAAGIVHRDLKPANMFLARRPDKTAIVKVLDFGISKSLSPDAGALTSTSSILGSPHYMSPEQLSSSKAVDIRSDIWAVGTILYQLLTGRLAYPGETMPQIVAAILQNDPENVAKARAEVPEALASVVHRCLETDPDARYNDVGELAAALVPFTQDAEALAAAAAVSRLTGADAKAPTARPPMPSVPESSAAPTSKKTVAATSTATTAGWSTPPSAMAERAPKRNVSMMAVVGLVLVGAAGSALYMRRGGDPPTSTQAPTATTPTSPPSAIVTTTPASATASAIVTAPAIASAAPSATADEQKTKDDAGLGPTTAAPVAKTPRTKTPVVAPVAPPAGAPTENTKKSGLHMELK